MDAACDHKNETVRTHGPADFACREQPAKNGGGNREKYDRSDATCFDLLRPLVDARRARLIQHEKQEKSLEPGNLGDVPNQEQNSKRKTQNFWIAENTHYQCVAVSGGESQKRSHPRRHFAGIGIVV